jgi:hypothetical protein
LNSKANFFPYPHLRAARLVRMNMFEPGFVIRRRKPRGRPIRPAEGEGRGAQEVQNNYLAETPKNRAGARPGNRNAVTHGGYTAESRARHAALRAAIRDLKLRAEILLAMVDGQGARRR